MSERQKLLPKLRFPEFREAGEWEERLIEDFFLVGSSKRVLQRDWTTEGVPFYRTRELVSLSKNEPFSSEIFISEELFLDISQNYGLPAEGDFLVSGVGTLGISYQVRPGDRFYFKDGNVLWFKANGYIVSTFFKYCFQSDGIQKQIFGQSSVSTVGTYTIQNAKRTKFFYPPDVDEQQQIADCLASLDELITLEAQKLDTLKTHKKVLMQQFFPAEGETLPKLRFPEFRDAGEWEENTLGELVQVASGQVDPTEPPYCNMPHVGGENIESHTGSLQEVRTSRELGLISGKYLFDERDVLYSKIRPSLNKVAIPDFQGICSADIYPLRPSNQKLCRQYLAYLLLSEGFLEYATKHSDRSKIPKVNRDSLLAYELVIPCRPEQEKIADCLASLDDLITAQTQQLVALRTQKKGLMQQLFPVLDEVSA